MTQLSSTSYISSRLFRFADVHAITHSVYTGYLDVDYGAKHMFFYFFESRRDPKNGL